MEYASHRRPFHSIQRSIDLATCRRRAERAQQAVRIRSSLPIRLLQKRGPAGGLQGRVWVVSCEATPSRQTEFGQEGEMHRFKFTVAVWLRKIRNSYWCLRSSPVENSLWTHGLSRPAIQAYMGETLETLRINLNNAERLVADGEWMIARHRDIAEAIESEAGVSAVAIGRARNVLALVEALQARRIANRDQLRQRWCAAYLLGP
jgi:hypothetical protein